MMRHMPSSEFGTTLKRLSTFLWWWSPRMLKMRFKYGPWEKFLRWLSWRMPRKLVYWCAIRLMVHATGGRWESTNVPGLSITDALVRWEYPN
jgi:hypothetical protein